MVILSVSFDNIYMFNDFYLDFTYSRMINNTISENDKLFPNSRINVRKNMILMGGNAAGKTTFGKLLCAINTFIAGSEISSKDLNLFNAVFDKNKSAKFIIEFVVEKMAYRFECVFNSTEILQEKLSKCPVRSSYNIQKLREALQVAKPLEYTLPVLEQNVETKKIKPFYSMLLKKSENKELFATLSNNIGFHYSFSNFAEQSNAMPIVITIKLLNKILPQIDNSIKMVVGMSPNDDSIVNNTYIIVFNNGDQLTIPDGDLNKADKNRLSHGTYETLMFLSVLDEIESEQGNIIFVDEKLAHIHSELEAYLIRRAFLSNRNSQIFITSHNNELLDLNIPYNAFMLFVRKQGYNQAFFISDTFNKNDRSLRNYYENDYFDVLPDYSSLDASFEEV